MLFFKRTKPGMVLYAYKDRKDWGAKLVRSCCDAGIKSRLFTSHSRVPDEDGVHVFINMLSHWKQDFHDMIVSLSENIALKGNAIMIPAIHECRHTFDKSIQAELFSRWMPRTWLLSSREGAEKTLAGMDFPFLSKSKRGHQSKNVRLIKDKASAEKEIDMIFSGDGIPVCYGFYQKGYLLWQEFLPGNQNDWRVVIIAKRFGYVEKRYNRDDVPFASGNKRYDVTLKLTDEIRELLDYGLDFARANDLSMCAIDVIRDREGRPVLVESQCTWGWFDTDFSGVIFESFESGWASSGYRVGQMFDVFAKAFNEGAFSGARGRLNVS